IIYSVELLRNRKFVLATHKFDVLYCSCQSLHTGRNFERYQTAKRKLMRNIPFLAQTGINAGVHGWNNQEQAMVPPVGGGIPDPQSVFKETLLFHGSGESRIPSILENGLQKQYARSGICGPGM